jgi:hypothetical protein
MKYLIPFLLICMLAGCQTESNITLRKASTSMIVEMHKKGQFNVDEALFLKEDGRKIDAVDVSKIKDGTYSCDYFVDHEGVIREATVRPTTYQDRIRYILIQNADYDPKYKTPLLNINCDSLPYNSRELYQTRLEDWPDDFPGKDTLDAHAFSKAKIVSIEEFCNISSENAVKMFWNMVHHNRKEVIAHYYLLLEGFVDSGLLKAGIFALTTDRLLVEHGYPQVFGSQIVNWKLYPVENPDSVDIRRAEVGLEPLEEYLKGFDLD